MFELHVQLDRLVEESGGRFQYRLQFTNIFAELYTCLFVNAERRRHGDGIMHSANPPSLVEVGCLHTKDFVELSGDLGRDWDYRLMRGPKIDSLLLGMLGVLHLIDR